MVTILPAHVGVSSHEVIAFTTGFARARWTLTNSQHNLVASQISPQDLQARYERLVQCFDNVDTPFIRRLRIASVVLMCLFVSASAVFLLFFTEVIPSSLTHGQQFSIAASTMTLPIVSFVLYVYAEALRFRKTRQNLRIAIDEMNAQDKTTRGWTWRAYEETREVTSLTTNADGGRLSVDRHTEYCFNILVSFANLRHVAVLSQPFPLTTHFISFDTSEPEPPPRYND